MKNPILLFLLTLPFGLFAQWNTDVNVNLLVSSNAGSVSSYYSGNGYFFCYSEDAVGDLIHRYNTDGTPNWAAPMSSNNRPVGSAIFTKRILLDNSGNLIHLSSFESGADVHYCITKIGKDGTQLWNGATGIEVGSIVVGAYLSPSNNLYVATNEGLLLKYDAAGVLQWSSTYADGSTSNLNNASIIEKTDGSVGLVFFKSDPSNFIYGNYFYISFSNTGVPGATTQIEEEFCRFFTHYHLTKDSNDNLIFLFTDQNDKAYIQKITADAPVFPTNGFSIDNSTTHGSVFQSARVKNGQLYILYHYYGLVDGPIGLLSQTIDLNTFTRAYSDGNILLNWNDYNVFTTPDGLIEHGDDFGFLIIDNTTKFLSYKIFDGVSIIGSHDVCTTSSAKNLASLGTLNNINASNSQIVVLFDDDRDNDFVGEAYAQNILFEVLPVTDHLDAADNMLLYPNPCHSVAYVKTDKQVKDIELFSLSGQPLSKLPVKDEIDLSNYPNGSYLVKITLGGHEIRYVKLIKE